jgi:protein-disulfide isomerase
MKRIFISAISVLILSCPSLLRAQSNPKASVSVKVEKAPEKATTEKPTPKTTSAPVATVDGQTISEDELLTASQGQLRSLRDQEYQIKRKALDSLISQKILEAEAKKKGVTAEKLVEQEVDAKVPEATEIELKAVYAVQREQLGKSYDEAKVQLQSTLRNARIQQARQEYSAHLRDQAKVAVLMSPPRVQVAFDPARLRGNPKAKVMIVEFSDFQCPYCRQAEATLKNVLAKHEGVVAVSYRDMPLTSLHPMAFGAAEAGRCAGEQGKFWELHDAMFADQAGLDHNGLIAKAKTLNLDEKQFETCLTSEKYKAQIQQDSQEASRFGINGTPAFFINGVFLNGAQPEAAFEKAIKEELETVSEPNRSSH